MDLLERSPRPSATIACHPVLSSSLSYMGPEEQGARSNWPSLFRTRSGKHVRAGTPATYVWQIQDSSTFRSLAHIRPLACPQRTLPRPQRTLPRSTGSHTRYRRTVISLSSADLHDLHSLCPLECTATGYEHGRSPTELSLSAALRYRCQSHVLRSLVCATV